MSPVKDSRAPRSGRHAAASSTDTVIPVSNFEDRVLPWVRRNILICVLVPTVVAFFLLTINDFMSQFFSELVGLLPLPALSSPITFGSTFGRVLAATLFVVLIVKVFRLKLADLGMIRESRLRAWFVGVGLGFAGVTVILLINVVVGAVQISSVFDAGTLWILPLAAVFFAFQGFVEELLFRFYLIPAYAAKLTVAGAIGLSSILFAYIHINNPNLTVFGMVNLVLYGVVFGVMYWRTGNAWFVAGWHSGWNFVLAMIYGSHVSGNVLPGSLLSSTPSGSELLNGGAFGLEGSVLSTLLGIAIIVWCIKTNPESNLGLFTRPSKPTRALA
ncbi:CPBP family intramembrane metalloprotease [Corynebacterium sp. CCM 9185]|uniref:CPBP family intramembrane metalloprotease n=1 Tax=Corynebacterium marambiense TaxID=2765364 RepID=A0ABS0VXU3_9CORY|nr:type II CAAX endopeptidase family protein [Corynebacterium marambiense]MBI9001597.1 CPBP family intramembrane metalloprotease [Corynebacterium marambiense]MCK7662061.1 CPBP family intramembrane metalloprotease [Corynebacterium marambiense]